MVSFNSQYKKHYGRPCWDDLAMGEYRRKLDYRIGRRSVEHQHQPWFWDSEDEAEIDEDVNLRRQVERRLRSKQCRRDKDGSKMRDKTENHSKGTSKPIDKGTEEEPKSATAAVERKLNSQTRTRPTKRRKKPTAVSTSNIRNTSQIKKEKEPFLPYGWANEGPIDKKYTYNVRASPKEVYPASLRALKRRELEVKRRLVEENQKKIAREREILSEKFFIHGPVSPTFLTEYQRSYCMQDVKTGYVW